MDYFRGKRFLDTLPDWERGRPHTGPVEHYLPRMAALLARLGNPERASRSVVVGGTNGKGTVSSLMASLLRSAGQVVSREDLVRQVLGRIYSPYDRSIDVHVSNLRKKLGHEVDGKERIKAIRQVGYLYAHPGGDDDREQADG